MTNTRTVFKSGLNLGANEAVGQAGSFLRSVIIARLVSPEDFGIAAIFALSFAFMEMISNLASERLLVQAEDGDAPSFQSTAQLLQAGRGTVNALLMFLLAAPLSHLFGVPNARWAFQCLAAVPLIKGFAHTDLFRLQRAMKFGPFIIVNVVTTALITISAVPLALWLRSYAVMVWVLIIQAVSLTVGTHLVAERPYRWTWNRDYARQIFVFGWPLLVNGLLMYLIFQGDRVVIGASGRMFARASYTHADLAAYSLAFSLTLMPTMLVANVCSALFLPVLSRVQNDRARFEQDYRACTQVVCLAAACTSVPLILAGDWLVVQIYGRGYSTAAAVIGWLAAMQAVRIIRVAPTLAAMAVGDTKNSMVSNLVRTLAFGAVLGVAAAGGSLSLIAASGLGGELLALAFSLWALRSKHGVALKHCLEPCAIVALGAAMAAAAQRLGVPDLGGGISVLASGLLVAVVFSVMLIAYPRLRNNLRSLVAW